ncbi:MAG: glycosyltransferase family 2 protein [Acidobacteria bacterium]|nr:glycosyltransferase family 2 protein [Acidobacteriota bacterium]
MPERPRRLSVIISTYRRPEGLRRAVESLDRQSRPPDEVIVAAWEGDGPTLDLLGDLRKSHGAPGTPVELRPVFTRENNVTAKENAAIASARGEVLCFMDDDAVARRDWLERLERHYLDDTVGGVGGRDVIWLDGRVLEREVREVGRVHWVGRLIGNHHERATGSRDVDYLKGCNMSYRRGALSPLDARLSGPIPYGFEIDLGLQARRRGWRIVYDPEVLVDHYPSTNYAANSPEIARIVNHNQTYVLLKHLSWTRKLAFIAYTFCIGDRNTIGVTRAPLLLLREGWSVPDLAAQIAGKLAGIRTYLRAAGSEGHGVA